MATLRVASSATAVGVSPCAVSATKQQHAQISFLSTVKTAPLSAASYRSAKTILSPALRPTAAFSDNSSSTSPHRRSLLRSEAAIENREASLSKRSAVVRRSGDGETADAAEGDAKSQLIKTIQLGSLFGLWYLFNIYFNIYNKQVLKVFPYPLTITTVQFAIGAIVVLLSWATNIVKRPTISKAQLLAILPLALVHTMGNAFTNVSLGKVAVSFTHTIKALEPFFSVTLSALLLGEQPTLPVILALMPIVGGVALASATEASFNWAGFLSAMASNLTFQSRNVLSKKLMIKKDASLDNINLFSIITILSFFLLLPVALLTEGVKFSPKLLQAQGVDVQRLIIRSTLAALCFHAYQQVSYMILQRVSPVTHSVGNCVKRVIVIVTSVLFFRTPVSPINAVGTAIALGGVFAYSRAKSSKPKNLCSPKGLLLSAMASNSVFAAVLLLALSLPFVLAGNAAGAEQSSQSNYQYDANGNIILSPAGTNNQNGNGEGTSAAVIDWYNDQEYPTCPLKACPEFKHYCSGGMCNDTAGILGRWRLPEQSEGVCPPGRALPKPNNEWCMEELTPSQCCKACSESKEPCAMWQHYIGPTSPRSTSPSTENASVRPQSPPAPPAPPAFPLFSAPLPVVLPPPPSLPHLIPRQQQRLALYLDLLLDWNQRMNLTAVTSRAEAEQRHIADSLSLIPVILAITAPPLPTAPLAAVPSPAAPRGALRLVDVGTGAGLPGVVLAVAQPTWQVTLVESLNKRCDFLSHVVRELGLRNVQVVCGRAEVNLSPTPPPSPSPFSALPSVLLQEVGRDPDHREAYDLAVARAVAEMRVLSESTTVVACPVARAVALVVAWEVGRDPDHREAYDLAVARAVAEMRVLSESTTVEACPVARAVALVVAWEVGRDPDHREAYDLAVARAVAEMRVLSESTTVEACPVARAVALVVAWEVGRDPDHREAYDLAVARAVAEMRVLNELCLPLIRVGGAFIAAKGPNPQGEVAAASNSASLLGAQLAQIYEGGCILLTTF
ncbi:unnamed protein product [Closterium sp. Yama58-4]|nr:unnamed protein product [Closterium sp. Yama58-4]